MTKIFETPLYPYQRHADQDAVKPVKRPVVVVGAGPIGLGCGHRFGNAGRAGSCC